MAEWFVSGQESGQTRTYGGGGGEDMRRFSRPGLGFPLGREVFECDRNCMEGRRMSCVFAPAAASSKGLIASGGGGEWAAGEPFCGALDVGEMLAILLCEQVYRHGGI